MLAEVSLALLVPALACLCHGGGGDSGRPCLSHCDAGPLRTLGITYSLGEAEGWKNPVGLVGGLVAHHESEVSQSVLGRKEWSSG